MITKLKLKYKKNRLWIYPLRYILTACILAVIVVLIDTGQIMIDRYIPDVFFTSIELAQTLLSTLAGSLLSITTFTFSTTMVVLTMYSSQFSPRVIENFLSEKITLKVLGIFMGGFFYCIISLFFMRKSLESSLVVSASIGVIYAILCLIYFAIFIMTVSTHVQAGNLISRLNKEADRVINNAISYLEKYDTVSNYELGEYVFRKDIFSTKSGYLELIDYDSLYEDISCFDCIMIIHPHTGDFIVNKELIVSIYFKEDSYDRDKLDKMDLHFICEDTRNIEYDYVFALHKIVEVALRAISPGINDPNTAIDCINILGVLLAELSGISNKYVEITKEDNSNKIIFPYFDFSHDLYETFYQIITYGKDDISIVLSIYKALENIIRSASDYNTTIVKEFAHYLESKTVHLYESPTDKNILKNARDKVLLYSQ